MRPLDDFTPPPINSLITYHSVHVLCTVSADNKRLRATHTAVLLARGSAPIWGVWTIGGAFQRFFGRKSAVADAYPKHVWRAKQGTWSLLDTHDKDAESKHDELVLLYRKGRILRGDETAHIVGQRGSRTTENGTKLSLVSGDAP